MSEPGWFQRIFFVKKISNVLYLYSAELVPKKDSNDQKPYYIKMLNYQLKQAGHKNYGYNPGFALNSLPAK